jgi:polar amino acid transport system substrate-binding protein
MLRHVTVLAALALMTIAGTSSAQSVAATPQVGSLRAVLLSNPVQGKIDPRTGAVTGPAADLTQGLASILNVSFSLKGLANAKAVTDAIRNGDADIGFLAIDPARADEVSYSIPYSRVLNNYVVRADSPIKDSAGIAGEGLRIGVEKGVAAELFLTRTFPRAQVIGANLTPDEILQRLDSKEFDVWAASKQRLVAMTAGSARYRILPESFLTVAQGMAVAKGNKPLLDAVNRFLEGALASGIVQKSLDAAGLVGVEAAKAGK